MKLNNLKKIIISLAVIIFMILGMGGSAIYAATGNLTAMLGNYRGIVTNNTGTITIDESNWGFALKVVKDDREVFHPIYQIYESNSGKFVETNSRLYCLNAKAGETWNNNRVGTETKYNTFYDLKKESELITTNLGNNEVYNIPNYDYYSSIIWLLDNFYIPNITDKEEFLSKSGIIKDDGNLVMKFENEDVKNANLDKELEESTKNEKIIYSYHPYHYHYSDNCIENNTTTVNYGLIGRTDGYCYIDKDYKIQDVILTDELIETVQQAALWYFTNYLDDNETWGNDATYNNKFASIDEDDRATWLKYILKNEITEYASLNNYFVEVIGGNPNVGAMYQEQAAILYNYLVDGALKAKTDGYTGATSTSAITAINYDNITKQADNTYKIGPITIKTTGNVDGIGVQVTDLSDNPVTFTMQDKSGNTIDSTKPLTEDNIKEGFYIISNQANVNVTAKGTGYGVKQTLWTYVDKTTPKTEQPIVEIEPEETDPSKTIRITNEDIFDLALRKIILSVNGKEGTNELGNPAKRRIGVDTDTINSSKTTATYNHRKDPVVVKTGDIVKYQISIYNEGDKKGYATKIVDRLPQGLALKGYTENGTTEGIYTTTAGGKTITYTYEYNPTTNEITITNVSKNDLDIYVSGNTSLSSEAIEIECEVIAKSSTSNIYLTNIAYIAEEHDSEANLDIITQEGADRDSLPSTYPQNALVTTGDKYNGYHGDNTRSVYDDYINETYFNGQQDDDDFEIVVIEPKEFDLKLVKYISAINGDTSKGRTVTKIDTTKLASGKSTTADYTLSKDVIKVEKGDYVTYNFRVYNEGEIDGYVTKLTDNIPLGLQFVQKSIKNDGKTITVYSYDKTNGLTTNDIEVDEKTYKLVDDNNSYWTLDKKSDGNLKLDTYDGDTTPSISIDVEDYVGVTNKLLKAYDSTLDTNKDGKNGLDYLDLTVVLKVSDMVALNKVIRNEAAITGYTTTEDTPEYKVPDRDSQPENWFGKDDHTKYQDDEDYDNIKLLRFDIALRKFITAVSEDSTIEQGEYINTKVPQIDISKLKTGEDQTAIYNHSKDAITVNVGDYVVYTIRVYNEGDLDGYASKITDYLPEYLNYIDGEFNKAYGWTYDSSNRSVTTTYLSSANGKDKILEAFDGTTLDSNEVKILCRVSSDAVSDKNITNIAEITEYQDEKGTVIDIDPDSNPNNLKYPQDVPGYEGNRNGDNASSTYYPGQEDDDDFDRVIVKEPKFDLALRKFITKINNDDVTTRVPTVTYEDEKITYTHPKDVLKVVVGDTVTYTIRVFNEGKIAGFAETVTDDIPEYLEYLPENATNVAYRWKMYDKDGNETDDVTKADKIVTDYTSKAYGEKMMEEGENITKNPNLLNAFKPSSEISDTNPEYVDVKVAFKVLDPDSSKYIIKNKAQISEDADENGNPVTDIDSIPNEWNDGEDDQDYENVSVEYFDLALLKYVSEVEVTEKGKTTTTKTGNKGDKNDIVPKVEIHKKKLNSTTVKFIYTIKVTNEGDIPGYVKELTDYVPEGLEFNTEDNKGWNEVKDGVIATELLSDTLLNPGESAKVKVTFRWINDEDNLGVKTNVAEISEDDNERGIPDRDSTPGNNKTGEDDIDDADVLLSIKTGMTENIIAFIAGGTIILLILASGVILIKKYVL